MQLIGLIMDYMIMHWEDIVELKSTIRNDHDLGERLPRDVASALNLFCHEKIGRWESNDWVWQEDPNYELSALRVYQGKKDRRKQAALYVDIGSDGRICSTLRRSLKRKLFKRLNEPTDSEFFSILP